MLSLWTTLRMEECSQRAPLTRLAPAAVATLATKREGSRSGTSTPGDEVPERLPSRFVASVATAAGAKRVKGALWEHSSILKVVHNDNIGAVQQAEVVLLTCK